MNTPPTSVAPTSAPPRALARVFPSPAPDKGAPVELIGLSLDNHVDHVTELARLWDNARAYGAVAAHLRLDKTTDRLVRAAQRHDEGKPQTFRLLKQYDGKSHRYTLTYSFKGHRFLVIDDDPYVDWLIRLHHEYDVTTITEAQVDLRRHCPDGEHLATCFPYDLYTLEMCDQIDAEASTCALSPATDDRDRERPFMEYHSTFNRDDGTLHFDPWPFRPDRISLDYPSFIVVAIQECADEWRQAKHGERLYAWERLIVRGGPIIECPSVVLTLCPEAGAGRDDEGSATRSFYGGVAAHIPSPNPMQQHMREELGGGTAGHGVSDGFVLLKAPTGSGKTEAMLAPALEGGRRLFLILPSRALVEDQRARINTYLEQASLPSRRTSVIVDTGDHSERTVWIGGVKANKSPQHRHLYDADVVVTTLDSFMYRYFAFGAANKSYIFPLRMGMQRGSQPPLFCFDEAHSYDTLAWQNFLSLIEALACDKALDVVVMSATISTQAQRAVEKLGAYVLDYTSGAGLDALRAYQNDTAHGGGRPHPDTTLFYHCCPKGEDAEKLVELALREWRPGRRIIVVVESVREAVALHTLLQERLDVPADGDEQVLYLYHGRLDADDRQDRYKEIAARDKQKNGPGYLLVTTSGIEVGCDLDAHVLLTTLCYPEQLVQRAGRCNRRAQHPGAALHVVGGTLAAHASSLSTEVRVELQEKLMAVLTGQNGSAFRAAEIVELIVPDLTYDDRAAVLYSLLSDYVYEGDRTAKPAHDKGLVLTRSWEPSITLYELNDKGKPFHQVRVPLGRCLMTSGDDEPAPVILEREYYDEEKREMVREPLRYGGCCYLHRLVARVPSGFHAYDPVSGYAVVPRFLKRTRHLGYRATVLYDYPSQGVGPEKQEKQEIEEEEGAPASTDTAAKSNGKIVLWYLRALPSTATLDSDASDTSDESEESLDSADDSIGGAYAGDSGGEE